MSAYFIDHLGALQTCPFQAKTKTFTRNLWTVETWSVNFITPRLYIPLNLHHLRIQDPKPHKHTLHQHGSSIMSPTPTLGLTAEPMTNISHLFCSTAIHRSTAPQKAQLTTAQCTSISLPTTHFVSPTLKVL